MLAFHLLRFRLLFSGKPISYWLAEVDKQGNQTGKRGPAWTTTIAPAIKKAQERGAIIAGVCWHQGESDVTRAHIYQEKLTELIELFRETTKNPELPFIIAQLNAGSYAHHVGDLALGWQREAQRRVARQIPHTALFGTTDCVVGDFFVHLNGSPNSAPLVGQRFGQAAAHLVYGQADTLGPRVQSVSFGNSARTVVVVECTGHSGELIVGPEARLGFIATSKLSETNTIPDPAKLGALPAEMQVPLALQVQGSRLILSFSTPLAVDDVISWAVLPHAAFGYPSRNALEFDVITDQHGSQMPSFINMPISTHNGVEIAAQQPKTAPSQTTTGPALVGINGTSLSAKLARDQTAGIDGWQQSNWNMASWGKWPNLRDQHGLKTELYWWGLDRLPLNDRKAKPADSSGDAIMRTAWFGRSGVIGNLAPQSTVDLCLYLNFSQMPADAPQDLFLLSVGHGLNGDAVDPTRAKKKHVEATRQKIFSMPQQNTWQQGQPEKEIAGNVIILTGVNTGPDGLVSYKIILNPDHPKKRFKNAAVTVNAVQIRLPE